MQLRDSRQHKAKFYMSYPIAGCPSATVRAGCQRRSLTDPLQKQHVM